jgi:hypothetical protein
MRHASSSFSCTARHRITSTVNVLGKHVAQLCLERVISYQKLPVYSFFYADGVSLSSISNEVRQEDMSAHPFRQA